MANNATQQLRDLVSPPNTVYDNSGPLSCGSLADAVTDIRDQLHKNIKTSKDVQRAFHGNLIHV